MRMMMGKARPSVCEFGYGYKYDKWQLLVAYSCLVSNDGLAGLSTLIIVSRCSDGHNAERQIKCNVCITFTFVLQFVECFFYVIYIHFIFSLPPL